MLEVAKLIVRSFDIDHLDLFWELQDTDEAVDRYDLFVLRSVDGAAGPYQIMTGPFMNVFQFRDGDVNRLHKWRNYFYKLKAVNKDTGQTAEFGPEWLRAEPDLISLEIQRRHQLALQEFNARLVILFPQITSGQRCPKCFDKGTRGNTIGRQKTQNCGTCFDTTFVGGFATPMLISLQFDPSPQRVQRTDTLEIQPTDTTARLGAFPPISPRDMIVEAENVRWRVESMTPTRKLRAVVHQELVMHEIPVSSIRYKIPINIALLTQFAPEREFTRPMSLGNEPRRSVGDTFKGDS